MGRRLLAALAALSLSACATTGERATDGLDSIARDYRLLQLTIGEKEPGYIDAYYGPPEVQAQAKADAARQGLPALSARVADMRRRLAVAPTHNHPEAVRRAHFLDAQLVAAATRLRMLQGEKLSFQDEAEGLFAVRPELPALSSFDPVVQQIDALIPGEGPLWQRIDTFNNRFNVPPDKLKPVLDAAIAECRRRTLEHFTLPPGEHFELSLVTNKPWGGYNYYQGNYNSKIEINTDLPVRVDRAIDLGCHEGYPGHHVYNSLLEQDLVKGRGWVEFQVYPLFSPESFIAEGSANYGIELAFPGNEAAIFDRDVLAPLAGLQGLDFDRYVEVNMLLKRLTPAGYTIAAQLFAGEIDEAQAKALLQRYLLTSPERAAKALDFDKTYRSYIINYGLGQDMVRNSVEAAGPDQAARWSRMHAILSEPTLPGDLHRS